MSTKKKRWVDKLEMLKDFIQMEGHTRVPKSLDNDRFPKLGQWVVRQRNAYRNEQLVAIGQHVATKCARISHDRIARLEKLGFNWDVRSDQWEERFEMLKQFVRLMGHAEVPWKADPKIYPKLGTWVATQRKAYRNEQLIAHGEKPISTNRITQERVVRLDDLGFKWSRPRSHCPEESEK